MLENDEIVKTLNKSTDSQKMIQVMMDHQFYDHKPKDDEIKSIVQNLQTCSVTIRELAQYCGCGYSWCPGILEDGKRAIDWVGQQCFALDIDGTISVEKAKELSKRNGLVPNIMYPSFNYSPNQPKFRMVFVAPEIIREKEIRDRVQERLQLLYYADPVCNNANRIFFGGYVQFSVDSKARLDIKGLLKEAQK